MTTLMSPIPSMRSLHQRTSLLTVRVILLALMSFAISPGIARAANTTWPQDTDLVMTGSGITLKILAGSNSDTLTVNPTTFTVTVASGEAFTIRYPAPSPGRLANDGSLSECTLVGTHNEVIVNGPRTVTFTPNSTFCTSGGGGGGGSGNSPSPLTQPPSGMSVSIDGGMTTTRDADVTLSIAANNVQSMRISNRSDLSDASWEPYAVTKSWTLGGNVPGTYTVYATFQSSIGLSSTVVSDTIQLTSVEPTPNIVEPPSGRLEPVDVGRSIGDDKGVPTGTTAAAMFCKEHELIKLPNDGNPQTQYDTAVYYCGRDGKRYVFTNDKVYFTWYRSFSGVTTVSSEFMASLPLGQNVTYRPTSRMVKVQSDPKVYTVEPGGALRPVPDEGTAMALFGPSWNTMIDDIDVAFFTNYTIGEPLPSAQ